MTKAYLTTGAPILLALGIFTLLALRSSGKEFRRLDAQEKYQRIIEERDLAIKEAAKEGKYNCCINPPCTMCYMEPNQWNNQTPGTCNCDNLIKEGKQPCPQCQEGECSEGTCAVPERI